MSNKRIRKNLEAYSFLLPNLILFVVCSLYPVLWALKYVFYQYGGYGTGTPRFVGLENLARVFRDKVYWESIYIYLWIRQGIDHYTACIFPCLFAEHP